ncbi:glycosyltransferase family 2 protein [Sulfobacillus thermosulfidooxidans]|uniref:glycosyltransferase family 2 protein n=1 Tax=Sulfobacillus thermosulfidooxidans TaxID=28034 RepID=UPI00096BB3B1|nr:glycosyltransferase [Sulfobacillus thermosulfidooxidans]OLZ11611.1 hypothetical protein BFX05_06330 [Sulfobacillus thermosulfidooxidans]OLZ17488.1 hypothetical protein BFX06_13280 [Sulfobacillus thermosulfidooxidans]OLZ21037.1 hypothetical protein BFX07_13535 [Sulfobacillus thermosulfidooxidans]
MPYPKISVIIPTVHNHTIKRALSSIATQNSLDLSAVEVFVIRDGQAPFTRQELGSYPFTLHLLGLLPGQGAAGARNVGLHFSSGQYIAFLDDDDEWLPNHLALTIPLVEKTQGIVFTDAELYHVQEGWHEPFRFQYQPSMLTKTSPVIPSTLVTTRATFEEIGYFDTQIPAYSDWDWILRASRRGVPITRLPEITANYYFSADSTSSRPCKMAPELRKLRSKHHLGPVPVANFAKMMTDPWFAKWRIPGP